MADMDAAFRICLTTQARILREETESITRNSDQSRPQSRY